MAFREQFDLGGSKLACPTLLLVDKSLPGFFRRKDFREESLSTYWFSDFRYLSSFRRYSRLKSKAVRNRPEFCTFLAPICFWGEGPKKKNRDLNYEIEHTSDDVAKSRVDRPRELGDLAVKKRKKNICSKT